MCLKTRNLEKLIFKIIKSEKFNLKICDKLKT